MACEAVRCDGRPQIAADERIRRRSARIRANPIPRQVGTESEDLLRCSLQKSELAARVHPNLI